MSRRETLLAETFVSLADTIVSGFDVVDFLSMLSSRCIDLFGAGDAGLMLADASGRMQVAASSSHEMLHLELFEIQHDEGPCPDAYHTGIRVACGDLREATERWPNFAPEAVGAGFRAAHALPMRLRDEIIGALNLIHVKPGSLPEEDLNAAQALADVATIGLLHHRAAEESRLLSDQLQYALNSRVVIEQARGVIGHSLDLDMDQSFRALRSYSHEHDERLVNTAHSIVNRSLAPTQLSSDQASQSAREDRQDPPEPEPDPPG
jgi:GAF domain-containing protein